MKLLKNKYVLGFVVGCLVTYFALPSKTSTIVKEVEKTRQVERQVDVNKVKVTKPDGTVVEKTTVVSSTKTKETQKDEIRQKIVVSQKKFNFYAGANVLKQNSFVAGINYDVLGPINVGLAGTYNSFGVYVTIGLRL